MCIYIYTYTYTHIVIHSIEKVFEDLDEDNSGLLSIDEVESASVEAGSLLLSLLSVSLSL